MRLKLLCLALGAVLLLATGFRPGTLPFIPGAAYSDATISHFPAALVLHDAWQRGEVPLWSETIMGGQPFEANPVNMAPYPGLLFVEFLPPLLGLDVAIVGQVTIYAP